MAKGVAASKADGAGPAVNKRKRKRQIRLPKGFDPENPRPPPDPERWLPKWQRSDFKRKRKGRKDKVVPIPSNFRTGRSDNWSAWKSKIAFGCSSLLGQVVAAGKRDVVSWCLLYDGC